MSDDMQQDIANALAEVIAKHEPGGFIMKWVVAAETIGPDGTIGVWAIASAGAKPWDTLGMLDYCATLERKKVGRGNVEA